MARLSSANSEQIREIYQETHSLWGGGLSAADLHGLWCDLASTAWGDGHARFYVWTDERGRVLSSTKAYSPLLRAFGQVARATVLAAVYTPRGLRGRGHATAMLKAVLEKDRRCGVRAAMLFSDIGPGLYGRLGFQALPAQEHWATLDGDRPAPPGNWSFREAETSDLEPMRRAHLAFVERRDLAVVRDLAHWEFLAERTRSFFARLGDRAVRPRCRVALRDGEFAGYLIAVEGRGEWSLREVGAPGGTPERIAEVLRAGALDAAHRGARRFSGWLAPEVVRRMGDWGLRGLARRRAVPMLLAHREEDAQSLLSARSIYLSHQDQF